MYRVLILLLIGVFFSSVGLWFIDQYEFNSNKTIQGGRDVVDIVDNQDGSSEEVIFPYAYGFFKDKTEVIFYDDLNVSDIERLLDSGRIIVALFDGSVLNASLYNFSDVRFVALNNYDGDYFYTTKFGMPVQGGYVISRVDFRKGYNKAGGFVVDISL